MENYLKIPQRVHFVGIGGIGISALAQHLIAQGRQVSGSDKISNSQTQQLQNLGAKIYLGHSATNIGQAQLVVHTSAVDQSNCELAEALRRHIPVLLREELLGEIFNQYPLKIAVCGIHGKTTVTAMLDHVFSACRTDHISFIGGLTDGTNYKQGSQIVIAEACEYRESFRYLKPDIVVVLNVEHDHPDYYSDKAAVEKAFKKFLSANPNATAVVNAQKVASHIYSGCKKVITFDDGEKFSAKDVVCKEGKYSFNLVIKGEKLARVKLNVVGKHNMDNALACLATAYSVGLPLLESIHALQQFSGADRRWTTMPCSFSNLVQDYAHHPTEIMAALQTAFDSGYRKVYAVFQPHTYTRTATFWEEFSQCFLGVEEVLFLPIYAARENPLQGVTSQNLCIAAQQNGINALYFDDFSNAAHHLKNTVAADSMILVLGAGDIYKICPLLR